MSIRRRILNQWPLAALAVWLGLTALGVATLWNYSNAPGPLGAPAAAWAGDADLSANRPTLVLYAHPRCPCTLATFSEVARLQGRRPGAFDLRIYFYEPHDANPEWRHTRLWRRARALPNTTVLPDPAGAAANAAGALTSGTAALHAPGGALLFWGGLTSARGHEGDNRGVDAVINHLDNAPTPDNRAPVFGCPILEPGRCNADASQAACCDQEECAA